MTLHSTCFLKMAYYESAMFKKVSNTGETIRCSTG